MGPRMVLAHNKRSRHVASHVASSGFSRVGWGTHATLLPVATHVHLYSVAADSGGLQRLWKLGSDRHAPLVPTLTR